MSGTTTPLLAVTGLSVAYGPVRALEDISLEIFPGETVALIGANGAGKSTLFKTVMGHLKPHAGHISFAGAMLDHVPIHRRVKRGLGYSPEGRRLFPGLTVRENLEVAIFAGAAERARRLDYAFSIFPALGARQAALGWQLSGGQQQMVAIARALMGAPRLLLLDEPSLGLSPKLADEVMQAVRAISASGTAVLLAEQNVSRSLAVCARAYVLEVGRVALAGTAAALEDSAEVRKAYLGG